MLALKFFQPDQDIMQIFNGIGNVVCLVLIKTRYLLPHLLINSKQQSLFVGKVVFEVAVTNIDGCRNMTARNICEPFFIV